MFGFDLSDVRQKFRGFFDAQVRTWAGAAFMVLALAAIEYDEFIAPEVSRISDNWSTVATDFSRKLASFTL